MMKLRLEAPWHTYAKKVKALFEQDPDIEVSDLEEIDGEEYDYALHIEVKNHDKFVALDRVIPAIKVFGNVIVAIILYDEANFGINPAIELYETIFKGNPIVKDIKNLVDSAGTSHGYVRFQPEVVQFFDDDLSDYNGNWTGLAEDIAREVFENDSFDMNFCTAAKNEDLNKPLGEWP